MNNIPLDNRCITKCKDGVWYRYADSAIVLYDGSILPHTYTMFPHTYGGFLYVSTYKQQFILLINT